MTKVKTDIPEEDRTLGYYQNKLNKYTIVYEMVTSPTFDPSDFIATIEDSEFNTRHKDCTPHRKILLLCEKLFYDCLAISSKLAFCAVGGRIVPSAALALDFVKIARAFMYLTGLDKEPDETHYILIAIELTAIYSQSKAVDVEWKQTNDLPEKECQDIIEKQFGKIEQFKKYKLIGSQVVLPQGDRLDILAEDIISKRPVIMECKKGNKSGHKQLRSYAIHYDNPILINISVKPPKNKRKDITYYVFDELIPDLANLHNKTKTTPDRIDSLHQSKQLELFQVTA